jgi:hypothetical protein
MDSKTKRFIAICLGIGGLCAIARIIIAVAV